MNDYNWYLRIARIVITASVFAVIAFGSSASKLLFLLAFLCSIVNDYARKRFIKLHSLYVVSLLLSMLIAGTMKYFVSSIMDGYLYILLIEILFRNTEKRSCYLLPPHLLAFLASDLLRISFPHYNASLLSSFGYDLLYYLLGLFIILSVRQIFIQKDQMQKLNADLNSKNEQLEQYQSKLQELALSAERNRVAQELHDSLGHTLMAIRMNIKVLEILNHSDPDKEKKIIQSLDAIVQDGIQQLRETVFHLKNDSEIKYLELSLQEMIGQISANGEIKIQLEFDDKVDECLPEVKDVVYKTVKECLTNSIRHGKAKVIIIRIAEARDRIYLKIEDDGIGCKAIQKSFGLRGIDDRLSTLGGHTSYESSVNQGFFFQADFPVYKRESIKQ